MRKIEKITNAIQLIRNGDTVGIGGNVLHRAPMAIIREIIRQNKQNLQLIKTAGAMDIDMLCFGGNASSVDAGFVSYESEFSLAQHYRKAVQDGVVKGNEHACYTVISALRAGAYGVPFMPVRGLQTTDLIGVNDYFDYVVDPFTSEKIAVVKAIAPDVTIIHVQEADVFGNAKIYGPAYDDVLLATASKKVIISAENIVSADYFRDNKIKVDIPHFMVTAVVNAPKGASPCSCFNYYDIDRDNLKRFKSLKSKEDLKIYLQAYKTTDRR